MQNAPKNQPLISIVSPFYYEEEGIQQYFDKLLPILEGLSPDFEIICVDDGSKDQTYFLLCAHAAQDPRIKVLRLARNFGKEAALSAGLDYARGRVCIPLDADLQDPPELIPQMLQIWQDSQESPEPVHIVLPIRSSRQDPPLKKLTAALFYKLVKRISHSSIPAQASDFRLMDQKVLAVVRSMKERHRFMRGILSWPGFNVERIPYQRPGRTLGTTKYNYRRMLAYAMDGIFGFSVVPLRFFASLGASVLLLVLILAIRALIVKFFYYAEPGYTSLLLVMLFLNGCILLGLGIVGEYIGRVYHEVKGRPIYVVMDKQNISNCETEANES